MNTPIPTWDTSVTLPAKRTGGWAEIARAIPEGGSVLFTPDEKPGSFKQALRNAGRSYTSRTRVMERDGERGLRVWVTNGVPQPKTEGLL